MISKNALPYFIFVIFAAACWLASSVFVKDPDVFWHLAAGKWMLDYKDIPVTNIFSFSDNDYLWLNISWLWDLIFGAMDKYAGIYMPLSFTILIFCATIAFIANRCLHASSSAIATVIVLAVGSIAIFPTLSLRPHMMTYLFIPIFIHMLEKYKAEDISFQKLAISLSALMILWANMHGGFMVAFTLTFAYAAEFAFKRNFDKAINIGFVTLMLIVASLINPLFLGIYIAVLSTLDGGLQNYIDEWQSPSQIYQFIYLIGFAIAFIFSIKKFSLAQIFLSILWLALAFKSARYSAIVFVITAPYFAFALKDFFIAKNAEYMRDLSSEKTNKFALNIALATAIFLLFSKGLSIEPNQAVAYLSDKHANARILNHYNYGGRMIHQGGLKTFIDGRAETAFSQSVIEDYIAFDTNADSSILDKYNIDVVYYPKSKLTDKLAANGWTQVYADGEAVILEKAK